ncbi:MAG: hypothetical protein CL607_12785 [Anaerolineaceae bacterium]|nr:hypothetical protein [Anaerolineaceae bacterium]
MLNRNKVLYIDGHEFRRLFTGGVDWLSQHVDTINNLNVFPVPDGDTGTNMLLTVQKAQSFVDKLADDHIGRMTETLATGARYGARGNSGTILSMLLRGFAQGLAACEVMDAQALSVACRHAVDYAYETVRSVMTPQEGTILTVAEAAAASVESLIQSESNLFKLLDAMIQAAGKTLEETPELLPVLKDAGVVDSGGAGLVALLEGFQQAATGEAVQASVFGTIITRQMSYSANGVAQQTTVTSPPPDDPEGYGYDVQFLMLGDDLDVAKVQADISAMGWSPLVDGDKNMIKVHIHVHNPAVPLDYAIQSGAQLDDIVVENMQRQYEAFASGSQPGHNGENPAATDDIAVIAVVRGDGLHDIFIEYGVTAIVEGGQTMNPSTGDLLAAVDALPNRRVILLPNNKNIILAARGAADISDRQITVVPTQSIPQGLAALLAFGDYKDDASWEMLTEHMHDAAASVLTLEVTKSTRRVDKLGDISIQDGDFLVLADGKASSSSADMFDAILAAFATVDLDQRELVTIYYGADVTSEQTALLIENLHAAYPQLQSEAVAGGQPLYPYVLSIE